MRLLLIPALLTLATTAGARAPACDADNGGLKLPTGFCAVLVGERLGNVRHFAVAPNGDILAATVGQQGGLVVVGSFVPKTTAQLAALRAAHDLHAPKPNAAHRHHGPIIRVIWKRPDRLPS